MKKVAAILFSVVTLYGAPPRPVYIGAKECAKCHEGGALGNQYSSWLHTAHSESYKQLAQPAAKRIVRRSGLREDDPQQSPICLGCHATAADAEPWQKDDSFRLEDGVQCEGCHGPGSEYASEAVMRDPVAAMRAGLIIPTEQDCMRCHIEKDTHAAILGSQPIELNAARAAIAHPLRQTTVAKKGVLKFVPPRDLPKFEDEPRYKTPLNLAIRPGGREIYVACEASDSVVVVDAELRKAVTEIPVGGNPADVTFSPDGTRAFVSNRRDDTVSEIDTATRAVIRAVAVGDEPHGLLVDRAGKNLYVLNTAEDNMAVLELPSLKRVKTLSAGRSPWSLALSPDGAGILVTNSLSRFAYRAPFVSEVTAVETERAIIADRRVVRGANLLLGIDWHPSGQFALATLNRTKNLVPMTRLLQGWTITNGLAILWADGGVDEVLLDEPNDGFADVTDVAFTPDGRYALATSAGSNRVGVIDVQKLTDRVRRASAREREQVFPNHLGLPTEFVAKHISTGDSPRGIVISADGNYAYVANSLDDSLTVIDLGKMEAAGRIDLGGPKIVSETRFGEKLFNNARIAFHHQFSCHTCHPDGHVDGLTYDIEADGIGISPVDNRTLRGILDTAPFKWEGTNPTLQQQCGPRLSVFFTRLAPFSPKELAALDLYITTIPRPPNRYHTPGTPYTPAQRRGKQIFERTTTNDGREIPVDYRCITCHPSPYYTNRQKRGFGMKLPSDRTGLFDVPHLNNIYDSPPYLHNGMAETLEEIWTVYNPMDRHGMTNDMTKDQLNDLIEYLKTL